MKEQKKLLIGLTGQTGAGKSTVSEYLIRRGFRVLDADIASRRAVEKGSECLAKLAVAFGREILLPNGFLDRKALGWIVFADGEKKKLLEDIIFPYITEIVEEQLRRWFREGVPAVFLDAPTLFESGLASRCDYVISVVAPVEKRLERILSRDGISREDALLRMNAQHDDAFFAEHSHFLLRNDTDWKALFAQVDNVLTQINLAPEAIG